MHAWPALAATNEASKSGAALFLLLLLLLLLSVQPS